MKKIIFPLIIAGIGITTLVSGIVASNINYDTKLKQISPLVKLQSTTKAFLFPNEIDTLKKGINDEINKQNYNLYSLLKNKTKINFPKLEDNFKYNIVINENKMKIVTEDGKKFLFLKNNISLVVKIQNTKTNENVKFLQKKIKLAKEKLELDLRFLSPFSLQQNPYPIDAITTPTTKKMKLFEIENYITNSIKKNGFLSSSIIVIPKTISSLSIDSITLKNKETKDTPIDPSSFEIKTIDVAIRPRNFNNDELSEDEHISKDGGGLVSLKIGNTLAKGEYKIKISMTVEGIKYTSDVEWLIRDNQVNPADDAITQQQLNKITIATNEQLNLNIFYLVSRELIGKDKNKEIEEITDEKIKEYFANPFKRDRMKAKVESALQAFIFEKYSKNEISIKIKNIIVSQKEKVVKIYYALSTLNKDSEPIYNLKNPPISIPFSSAPSIK